MSNDIFIFWVVQHTGMGHHFLEDEGKEKGGVTNKCGLWYTDIVIYMFSLYILSFQNPNLDKAVSVIQNDPGEGGYITMKLLGLKFIDLPVFIIQHILPFQWSVYDDTIIPNDFRPW